MTAPEGAVYPMTEREAFVGDLLEWYEENGRHDLPWRDPTASPFQVLVAELILQKTSAGQVSGVFDGFVDEYPDPKSVADASEEEIAEEIEPLGLQKRVGYFGSRPPPRSQTPVVAPSRSGRILLHPSPEVYITVISYFGCDCSAMHVLSTTSTNYTPPF